MPDAPLVTVIIPVYNRPQRVLESIGSAIAAEVALEVVVVDDCSTDDTWRVLHERADATVRVFRLERNSGQSAARNRGLEAARGEYVKFLDSDDLLLAEHLGEEVRALAASGADIVVSGWAEIFEDGTTKETPAPVFESIPDDVVAGLAVPTSSALYRRRAALEWDESLRKLDDWDYFCQCALRASKIETVPGAAYVWRQHGGERATKTTMLANAREHHRILGKIERELRDSSRFTEERRLRLAQYYYKELRVMTLADPEAAESALRHIFELDPRFVPRDEEQQPVIRWLTRVIGVRSTLSLYRRLKSLRAR